MKSGIERIADERNRQIEEEGWDEKHDSQHNNDELPLSAICYASPINYEIYVRVQNAKGYHFVDPWPPHWWRWDKRNKHSRVRRLEIAGALIAAEIDRLLKLE